MTCNEFAHLDEAAIADEGADANAAQVADDGKYLLQGLGQFDAKQVNTGVAAVQSHESCRQKHHGNVEVLDDLRRGRDAGDRQAQLAQLFTDDIDEGHQHNAQQTHCGDICDVLQDAGDDTVDLCERCFLRFAQFLSTPFPSLPKRTHF